MASDVSELQESYQKSVVKFLPYHTKVSFFLKLFILFYHHNRTMHQVVIYKIARNYLLQKLSMLKLTPTTRRRRSTGRLGATPF